MAFGIVHISPQGFDTKDYADVLAQEVFVAQMAQEVACCLFKAFVINMLNLADRKKNIIFDERKVIKGNGVRGSREAWNAC